MFCILYTYYAGRVFNIYIIMYYAVTTEYFSQSLGYFWNTARCN